MTRVKEIHALKDNSKQIFILANKTVFKLITKAYVNELEGSFWGIGNVLKLNTDDNCTTL